MRTSADLERALRELVNDGHPFVLMNAKALLEVAGRLEALAGGARRLAELRQVDELRRDLKE